MFSSFSLPFNIFGYGGGAGSNSGSNNHYHDGNRRAIALEHVPVHDVETLRSKEARALKHILKINHANHAIIYHELQFHNHAPHILGSAYLLGASVDQLDKIYNHESKELEPWTDAPGEISKDDWRDYLGKREYQRAWVDFFEDQVVVFGYDWRKMMEHFLYEGEEPLINAMACSLGHPLIHLAYAYELNSRTVGVEALAMVCTMHDDQHKYTDNPSYTRPASYTTTSVLEILRRVAQDERLNGIFESSGNDHDDNNMHILLSKHEDVILDHWNAWEVDDAKKQFEEMQKAAAAVLVATTHRSSKFDFFLCHVLTTSHAIRVMLPIVPAHFQIPLVRQWLFFVLSAYISQSRPAIDLDIIENTALDGKSWSGVVDRALNSEYAQDSHFVKAIRAMKNASETWDNESSQYFLKAAVQFSETFDGWRFRVNE